MATFKVGPKAQAGSKPTKQIAPTPKTSFAETLAARTGAEKAPKQAATRADPSVDPRAEQLKEMLEQQLVSSTRSIAKKANIEKEEAKGGMEGDG